MMADIEVMGEAGLAVLRRAAEAGAHCIVPTTTNARCTDFVHAEALGQDPVEIAKEREVVGLMRQLGAVTADTCINYQTLCQPHLGERVVWGDTGTVNYASSVFGARSNFESGPAALAAALTGRTPAHGLQLEENRRATFVVRVEAGLRDLADWGALGRIVGEANQSYYALPVLVGPEGRTPTADELKQLACSLASYGSMPMFHMVGVTPEAPDLATALGGRAPDRELVVTERDLERVFAGYDTGDGRADLVVFSGPQLSVLEMKALAEAFGGRRAAPETAVFVATNAANKAVAADIGVLEALETAGVTVLQGVCFYLLQNLSPIRERRGWTNLVTNSAKLANVIGAHRFNTILRRTDACVQAAVAGRVR